MMHVQRPRVKNGSADVLKGN